MTGTVARERLPNRRMNGAGHECICADKHHFLVLLTRGWRFPDDIAQEMYGPHGAWSVFLRRPQ